MIAPLETWDLAARLLLAAAAGAVLGWEREAHDKPAGLRTHMMVALGAAVFMLISLEFMAATAAGSAAPPDPLRVLQGIVGGVGFLCGGAIIQSGGAVRGLTTATSIWLSAAVGIASAMGFYGIAIGSAVLGLAILLLLGYLEFAVLGKIEDDEKDSHRNRPT
jgi:putative Mg2+ transporter-C (MgtC) family protein